MKTTPLKSILPVVGIFVLSGCYTQLSEPLSREEYYAEPDTVYQYEENDLSEYNLGYRDFLNDHLWYGYNPDSYFYHSHRPYWNSPWSYHHSFYLGVYDPYFYDPFWDWGYSGYYSPYSYYGYNYGYYHPYSRHYYSHGYYYGGYAGTKKVSEGREQKTSEWHSKTSGAMQSQSVLTPKNINSDFQNTLNLPMASGGGSSSTASGNMPPNTQSLPDGIVKPGINARDIQSTKSPNKNVPGFQTTLIPPVRPETKLIKNRSTSSNSGKRTITLPIKKSSTHSKSVKPSKSSSSSSSETKSVSKPKSSSRSSSGKSSRSSYKAPSKSSSSSSSSSRSSSVRSSPKSKSSSSSSSRSSSSKSSSKKSSSSKSSSKKNR